MEAVVQALPVIDPMVGRTTKRAGPIEVCRAATFVSTRTHVSPDRPLLKTRLMSISTWHVVVGGQMRKAPPPAAIPDEGTVPTSFVRELMSSTSPNNVVPLLAMPPCLRAPWLWTLLRFRSCTQQ